MIPEEVIQRIRETANIREVVEEYVPLRKAGRNWVGVCPFHADTDPSFTVNEDKQFFYCFGCGEGGNVFKFIMNLKGLTFIEAVKYLAKRYAIDIPERPLTSFQREKQHLKDILLRVNEEAANFYSNLLEKSDKAKSARLYLKNRGINAYIIKKFRLGWAPDMWDSLINHLKSKNFPLEAAEKAGLIVAKNSGTGYYDRFRSRIIFPIQDLDGNTIALGGRLVSEGRPKYLNSPETSIYHKGKTLYGLYETKEYIRKSGLGIVVEGYMDLLALVQEDIKNVIATLGTALTPEHIGILKRQARNWVLLFDGDSAGTKAALRALPLFFSAGLNVKVLTLPDNHDPDSFVKRNGREQLLSLIESSPSGIDFAVDYAVRSFGTDIEGKRSTVDLLLPMLGAVSDPVLQALMVGRVAQKLGLPEESILKKLEQTPQQRTSGKDTQKPANKSKINRAEAQLLGFLILYPDYQPQFMELNLEQWLTDQVLKEIWSVIQDANSSANKPIDITQLLNRVSNEEATQLIGKIARNLPPIDQPEEMANELREFCKKRHNKILRQQLLEQVRVCESEEQKVWLERLQRLQ